MTLRELINSVDFEQYSDSPLYQKLRETKPEYGSNRHIQMKLVDGEIVITNVHVGLMGDIITYPIDVNPDLNISKVQILDFAKYHKDWVRLTFNNINIVRTWQELNGEDAVPNENDYSHLFNIYLKRF